MKKIITLINILVIINCVAYSQSLSLSIGPKVVSPDSVYKYICSNTVPNIEYISVTNVSEDAANVTVKKVIVDTIPGTLNTFCWGVNCFEPSVYVSPTPIMIFPQATNTSFYGEYNPMGKVGSSTITYVYFNNDDPEDSASVTIKYILKADAVDDYTNNFVYNVYPNPADNQLNLSYDIRNNIQNSHLVIYNQSGQMISDIRLNDTKGIETINTSSLPNGLYSFTLSNPSGIYSAKKFQVIH